MAGSVEVGGIVYYVPGVYARTLVSSTLAGPTRPFQTPVLMAGSVTGIPYDVADKLLTGEALPSLVTSCSRQSDVDSVYGPDSDCAIAFRQAKRVGLPYALVLSLSSLTRASVLVQSAGPENEFTLYPKTYGAPGGWYKVSWTGGKWSTLVPRSLSLLVANTLATDVRVYVRDNSWCVVGMTVEIGDNVAGNSVFHVANFGTELDAAGQKVYWIDLDGTVDVELATSEYAAVAYYKASDVKISGTLTTGQGLIDYLTGLGLWMVVKHADYTGALPITISTLTTLRDLTDWSTVVGGTSPAATAGDAQAAFDDLADGGMLTILANTGLIPRLFLLGMSSATAHASAAAFALGQRTGAVNIFPVAIVTGCAWGDYLLDTDDDNYPLVRAANLDSQDVQLCDFGRDNIAACLSFAAQVWGLRARGGVNYNLTAAQLKGFPEGTWNEQTSGLLTAAIRAGVTSHRMIVVPGNAYDGISQGNNTLQNNASSWNALDATTPLANQRDLVDYIQLTQILTGMGALYQVTGEISASRVVTTYKVLAEKFIASGYIQSGSYGIDSVDLNATGTGWEVTDHYKVPVTTDFINITSTLSVGE